MRFSTAIAANEDASPPPFLDLRFDAKARALPDSGTTVICHITDKAANAALAAIRDSVVEAGFGRHWAWLPPSSYHMTVFDLVLHSRRASDFWPKGVEADASDADVDAEILRRMRAARIKDVPPFRVKPHAIYVGHGGMGVALTGADAKEESRLRAVRDRLADAAGLAERPGHQSYPFHITLAYLIDWPDRAVAPAVDAALTAAEQAFLKSTPDIPLGAPEVCTFQSMRAFDRQFFLGLSDPRF